MRTPTISPKTSKKQRAEYARLWAAAQLRTFTKDDIVERLTRFRTFYVMAWEDCLVRGEITEARSFYGMIDRITSLMADLAAEKAPAGLTVARAVMSAPLMLAPMENLDFAHLLDGGSDVVH